jgi:hypothetical protein
MTESEILDALANNTVRIDACIPVNLAVNTGAAGDLFRDFVADDLLDSKELRAKSKFFDQVAKRIEDEEDDDDDEATDFALEWIGDSNVGGFIVKAARPVFDYWPNGAGSYSWGCYNTVWLWGETLEDALTQAISWGERLEAEQKAEGKKKAR